MNTVCIWAVLAVLALDVSVHLEHLRYLNFSKSFNFNDWCLARMYQFQDSLEFLDISGCWEVTENGLAGLHSLKWVQWQNNAFHSVGAWIMHISYVFIIIIIIITNVNLLFQNNFCFLSPYSELNQYTLLQSLSLYYPSSFPNSFAVLGIFVLWSILILI